MTQTSINYGIVLYELGISRETIQDAKAIFEESPELCGILTSPVVGIEKKHAVIDRIFPKEMVHFLKTACDHQRLGKIEDIFEAYEDYYRKQQNILTAVLFYVTPPDEVQEQKFKQFLCKKYGCREVIFQKEEKPELIGGFVLRVGNDEYDRSLRGRIWQMKQTLTC